MTRMAPMHRTSGSLASGTMASGTMASGTTASATMASGSTATSRTAAVELRTGTHVVSARWRLGLRGTLTLEVHDVGRDGVARATASIARSRDTGARVVELRAQLDATECGGAELRWTLTSISEGSPISARAALVRASSLDAAPLLVTDLPEALGLQGGTYVLESLVVTPDAI